jgi:hypothetical protein
VDLPKRRVYSVVSEPLFAYDFAHVLEEDFRLVCSKCRWGEYPPKACIHIKAVLCWKRRLALSATWLARADFNTILDSLS